jgi:hypothetical protein
VAGRCQGTQIYGRKSKHWQDHLGSGLIPLYVKIKKSIRFLLRRSKIYTEPDLNKHFHLSICGVASQGRTYREQRCRARTILKYTKLKQCIYSNMILWMSMLLPCVFQMLPPCNSSHSGKTAMLLSR